MRHLAYLSAAALVANALAAPALAQSAPATAPQQAKSVDPNEVVCEKQEETGSRLASHRVCKTRAEWAEERRLDRMDIDKMQTQRGCNGSSGC